MKKLSKDRMLSGVMGVLISRTLFSFTLFIATPAPYGVYIFSRTDLNNIFLHLPL